MIKSLSPHLYCVVSNWNHILVCVECFSTKKLVIARIYANISYLPLLWLLLSVVEL